MTVSASAMSLAREIADLKRRIASMERASQAKNRSVENGALTVYDADGNPMIILGRENGSTVFQVTGQNGGKVVADEVKAGAIDGETITGVTITADEFRTAETGRRLRMRSAYASTLHYETGRAEETRTGYASMYVDPSGGCHMEIAPPRLGDGGDGFAPFVGLFEAYPGQRNSAQIAGQYVYLDGDVRISAPDDSTLSACSVTAGLQSGYAQDWISSGNTRVAYVRPDGSANFGGQEVKDTGWVTTGFTAATDWSILNAQVRKLGSVCFLYARMTRDGSTITVPSDGNVANIDILTLPSGYSPSTAWYADFVGVSASAAGHVFMDPATRLVELSHGYPGGTIATGEIIRVVASYLVD